MKCGHQPHSDLEKIKKPPLRMKRQIAHIQQLL